MKRRSFIQGATASTLSALLDSGPLRSSAGESRRFSMAFAPHFGMFANSAGEDLVDQLRFAADQGFYAWEDNPMKDRNIEDQSRIAREMERLGIQMGVISALKGVWKQVNFAGDDKAARDQVVEAISPTDHRGKLDSQHRPVLGRDRVSAVRR